MYYTKIFKNKFKNKTYSIKIKKKLTRKIIINFSE